MLRNDFNEMLLSGLSGEILEGSQTNFFAINILSNEQTELSNRFATFDGNRFDGVNWKNWETGAPILDDAIAAIDCRRKKLIDAGDHIIILGEVLRAEKLSEQNPLIYFNGKYAKIEY